MKTKPTNTRVVALMLCFILLAAMLAACRASTNGDNTATSTSGNAVTPSSETNTDNTVQDSGGQVKGDDVVENTRAHITSQLSDIEKKYRENPQDENTAIEYAGILYKMGNFIAAKAVLEPLLDNAATAPQAIYLLAEVEYLQGNYDQSLAHFKTICDVQGYEQLAETGLLMNYYQKNEYDKGGALFPDVEDLGLRDLMKAFGDREPYQIEWTGAEEKATIPFDITDPLPIVSMEINGRMVDILIDTGAAEFFVDEELAAELGIEPISMQAGVGGGGHATTANYSIIDTVAAEGITVHLVPAFIFPTKHFSDIYKSGEYQYNEIQVNGIMGTKFLQQFLPTMDYPQNQLVLRPKNADSINALQSEISASQNIEVLPFYLALDHFMIGQITTNGENLNYFYDSGLDDDGLLLLAEETLNYLGIPIPKIDTVNEVGGAGGAYSYGTFHVDTLKLGHFQYNDVAGLYGIFPEAVYYDTLQFFCDGLISHRFLKNYSWTIDFDSMEMVFMG